MIEKKFGILCKKCKSILTNDGECFCKNIGLLKNDNFWFIYTDNPSSFEFILGYFEGDRALKIVDMSFILELGKHIELNLETLKKIKLKKE